MRETDRKSEFAEARPAAATGSIKKDKVKCRAKSGSSTTINRWWIKLSRLLRVTRVAASRTEGTSVVRRTRGVPARGKIDRFSELLAGNPPAQCEHRRCPTAVGTATCEKDYGRCAGRNLGLKETITVVINRALASG